MHNSLLRNVRISRVANSAAAGITDVDSSILDMAGFDSVLFIAILGDVTATSVLGLTAQANDLNQTGGMASLAGAPSYTAGATDADNKVMLLDVRYPRKRYVRAKLTRTVANAVVDGVLAIQYNAKDIPVSQPAASVLASLLINDPA